MNPIRIHLGPMPQMLRAIIGDLLGGETDLLVVGRSEQGQDMLRMATEEEADVLITHDRARKDNLCLNRISAAAPLAILAISDDGQTANAVGLSRWPVALNGGGASGLAEAVREIADFGNSLEWRRQRRSEKFGRRRPWH